MTAIHVPQPVPPMMPRTLFNADHEQFRQTARRFLKQKLHHFMKNGQNSNIWIEICGIEQVSSVYCVARCLKNTVVRV